MTRTLALVLTFALASPALAQRRPAKPKHFPDVSWSLYHDLGVAKMPGRDVEITYELDYHADGSIKLRGAGKDKDDAARIGETATFTEQELDRRQLGFLLKNFRETRKQIAAKIVRALEDTKVRDALIAEGDLLVAHLAHTAAKAESDDAKKQQMTSLAELIVFTDQKRHAKTVAGLMAIAKRWVSGKMEDLVMEPLFRGRGAGKARLYFVTHGGKKHAVLHHRTGRISVHTAEGDRGYPTLREMKRRDPALYTAWRGDREGLQPVRSG